MKKITFSLYLFFFLINTSFGQVDVTKMCSHSKINSHNKIFQLRNSGNQDNFDIHYYKMEVEVIPGAKNISGSAEIHCNSLINNLKEIDLDLTTSLSVSEIKTNNKTLSFSHSSDLLKINLGGSYSKGESIIFTVKYSGQPDGKFFHFDTKDGLPMVWTLTEPYGSMGWFPCKNLPDDKIDSLDLIVTVPSSLIAASNGILTHTDSTDNKKTFFWKERYPIASYLISLAIHPYKIRTDYFHYGNDSMPVVNYIIPSQFEKNSPQYEKTTEMLKAFTIYFGEYPFIKEKYGNAEFLWGGGMEHQTLTSLLGPYEFLIAHELGHQWWGDMITCKDFHHIWLNEGFATYSEALWDEYKGGEDALHKKMKEKKYLGHGTVYVEDITNSGDIFDGNLSYKKASWVLHMLRHIVGDNTFFQILHTYADSDKKYDVATTEDFKLICEQVSQKNLGKFFDQWIYGDFHPIYLYDWSYSGDSGNYQLELDIQQFQVGNLFSMPIDISITTESGVETFVIENSEKLQSYNFNLNSKPISVDIDKNEWILKEVRKGINIINQDNNEMILSIASDGSLGYIKPDGFGNGLIYPQRGNNILFYGSFMLGNSDDYVVDNSEKGGHKDFMQIAGTKIEINGTTISNLDINIKYSDAGHPSKKGVRINQTSYSWSLEPDRDFILFDYTIKNNSTEDIDDFYAAQFLDFDFEDFTENYISKDENRNLLFQNSNGVYSGIRLLSKNTGVNFGGILSAVDYLNENEKYSYLTGSKNDFKENIKGDWSSLLSAGPFNLKAGDSITIYFAVIGGISEEGIKLNSDLAQEFSDKLFTSTKNDVVAKNNSYVTVFPNPTINKINLELYLPFSHVVGIDVYNITGKKVYSEKSFYKQGISTITINRPLIQGMYFYKINTKSGVLTGKIVK